MISEMSHLALEKVSDVIRIRIGARAECPANNTRGPKDSVFGGEPEARWRGGDLRLDLDNTVQNTMIDVT